MVRDVPHESFNQTFISTSPIYFPGLGTLWEPKSYDMALVNRSPWGVYFAMEPEGSVQNRTFWLHFGRFRFHFVCFWLHFGRFRFHFGRFRFHFGSILVPFRSILIPFRVGSGFISKRLGQIRVISCRILFYFGSVLVLFRVVSRFISGRFLFNFE